MMTKARAWPNNAKEIRDRAGEEAITGTRALRPLLMRWHQYPESEKMRRVAISLSAHQQSARLMQAAGAPIMMEE